jgi:hypothetical protein
MFPLDVAVGSLTASLICAIGVKDDTWFFLPLGCTALLAIVLVLATWARRRIWTHDGPTLVAGICVFSAFFVAFAVLSESFAQAEQIRGYGKSGANSEVPWTLFGEHPIIRTWDRSAFPLPLRRRTPTKIPGILRLSKPLTPDLRKDRL